jgi:hypothetical protein
MSGTDIEIIRNGLSNKSQFAEAYCACNRVRDRLAKLESELAEVRRERDEARAIIGEREYLYLDSLKKMADAAIEYDTILADTRRELAEAQGERDEAQGERDEAWGAIRVALKHSNAKHLSWRSEGRGVNESDDVFWRRLPAVKAAKGAGECALQTVTIIAEAKALMYREHIESCSLCADCFNENNPTGEE